MAVKFSLYWKEVNYNESNKHIIYLIEAIKKWMLIERFLNK